MEELDKVQTDEAGQLAKGIKIGSTSHAKLSILKEQIRLREGIPTSYEDAVKFLLEFHEKYMPIVRQLRKDLIIE